VGLSNIFGLKVDLFFKHCNHATATYISIAFVISFDLLERCTHTPEALFIL
jgi:hypothetical protein